MPYCSRDLLSTRILQIIVGWNLLLRLSSCRLQNRERSHLSVCHFELPEHQRNRHPEKQATCLHCTLLIIDIEHANRCSAVQRCITENFTSVNRESLTNAPTLSKAAHNLLWECLVTIWTLDFISKRIGTLKNLNFTLLIANRCSAKLNLNTVNTSVIWIIDWWV